ncbi:DUF59 domain-containing protein [bacterium]|nr:DUF59 domain-containing protein [bacterium]
MKNFLSRFLARQREGSLPEPEPLMPPPAPTPAPEPPPPAEPVDVASLQDGILRTLKTCYDPEIPVNIYDLGLVYDVKVEPDGAVQVVMTLTSPHCPVAESLPAEVREKISLLPGVRTVKVDVVWEPQWGPDMMSDAAKLELNLF